MSPEIQHPQDGNDLDLDSPDFPPAKVSPIPIAAYQKIIEAGWVQTNKDEIDLPTCYVQWLLQGDVFTRRRLDLEKKFTSPPTIMEIKQERRVAIVVIADKSLPCDEVKFERYDPNKHPDIDSINIFKATPAEAVRLLELAEAFSEATGSAQNLQNTRKAGASRGIRNTASLT